MSLRPTFDAMKRAEGGGKAVAVLMSGGVDSSVAALLLRDAGWDVVGITMKIPPATAPSQVRRPCCGTSAALVCKDLGIPHYFVDTEQAFERWVIEPFRRSYCAGKTPSPCIDCNTRLKFDVVWSRIRDQLKIADLATGHYARIEAGRLKRARDKTRDQSYFLYGAPREHLTHLHFPLGDLAKTEVRRIASSRGVFVAAKPDSMELCFAAEDDYRRALSDVPAAPGPIRDLEGKRLGEHQGIHNFTIGQRRGLGISSADRLYVVDLLPAENTVVVGTREQGTKSVVRATLVNVLLPEALCTGAALLGKIRSVGEPEPCRTVALTSDAVEVVFDPPVFGPAPGQHLVLYDAAETVVAGGVIESAEPAATQ